MQVDSALLNYHCSGRTVISHTYSI